MNVLRMLSFFVAITVAVAAPFASASASTTYGVLNGPQRYPGASGDYGASGYASVDHDFTARVLTIVPNASNQYASVNTGTTGNVVTVAANTTFSIRNTLQNTGSAPDTFTIAVPLNSLPSGWKVALYAAKADGSMNTAAPISATQSTAPISPNATADYYAVYSAPAALTMNAYFAYNVTLRAKSVNGGSAITNDTQHVIFVNGFVQLTKSVSITPGQNGCPAFAFPNVPLPVCSGGTITYTIAYQNLMPPAGTNNVAMSAIGFMLTEDGSGNNGWAIYTNGLQATPVDAGGGTIACPSSTCAKATSFTDTLPTLAPQMSGSVSFRVVVR